MYVEQKLIKLSSVEACFFNTFMDHLQDSAAAKSLSISTACKNRQVAMAKASRTLPRCTWALRLLLCMGEMHGNLRGPTAQLSPSHESLDVRCPAA